MVFTRHLPVRDERDRKKSFFERDSSMASFRISFSIVFLPSSRCSSRICCGAA